MCFMFLTWILNFMSIECYLLFYPKTYFLYIILNYINLKFKYLIDNITIDFRYFENFASIEDIRRKYISIVDLSKFTSNKKILSEVKVISCNKICNQTLFYEYIITIEDLEYLICVR